MTQTESISTRITLTSSVAGSDTCRLSWNVTATARVTHHTGDRDTPPDTQVDDVEVEQLHFMILTIGGMTRPITDSSELEEAQVIDWLNLNIDEWRDEIAERALNQFVKRRVA